MVGKCGEACVKQAVPAGLRGGALVAQWLSACGAGFAQAAKCFLNSPVKMQISSAKNVS